jgi:hypothetical protein
LETPYEKLTKGQNLGRLVGATMLRVGFPIVKIPLNLVSETANYTAGLPVGLARVAHAYATGFDGLKPVEKTAIIRQLSKGSLGAAVFMLGFCNPNNVGGYYQKYEKREADEAQAGGAKLFGTNIPRILLHNPLLEVAQIGATLRRVSDSRSKKTQEDPNGLGVGMLAAGLGVIDEIPFVSGTTALDKLSDPSQRSSALGRMIASRTIPGGLDWIAQETDRDYDGPIKRKPTTVLENLKAGIPGLRQTVPLAPEPKK